MTAREGNSSALQVRKEQDVPMQTVRNSCNLLDDPDSAGVYWSSLSSDNPEHIFLMQEIGNSGSTTIDQWIGKVFKARNAYINRWSTVEEETGELISGYRVTLISAKGEFLSFTGQSAINCFQRICSLPCIGKPPWPGDIPMEVAQVPMGKKRRHTLIVPKADLARLIAAYQGKQPNPV